MKNQVTATGGTTNQTINGKREGFWKEYHSNGQLRYEGNYVNGTREGS